MTRDAATGYPAIYLGLTLIRGSPPYVAGAPLYLAVGGTVRARYRFCGGRLSGPAAARP